MIQIEKTDVFGWESAIRGMRNPMNSWDKSDSEHKFVETDINGDDWYETNLTIGNNDLKLMKNLSKAGNDHAKYLRMINVACDITAPLYWWKEYDTYKIGTVANSCSTMHKIHAREFTLDDFSTDHMFDTDNGWIDANDKTKYLSPLTFFEGIIYQLNVYREKFLETNDKKWWWQMIQLLPSSYSQKRTVQLNYQVLKSMYFARKNHKLDEWITFCEWCERLPYFKEICIEVNNNNEQTVGN